MHGPFPGSVAQDVLSDNSALRVEGLLDLQLFVQDLFTFKFDRGFFISLLTAGVCLALLVVVGSECGE